MYSACTTVHEYWLSVTFKRQRLIQCLLKLDSNAFAERRFLVILASMGCAVALVTVKSLSWHRIFCRGAYLSYRRVYLFAEVRIVYFFSHFGRF